MLTVSADADKPLKQADMPELRLQAFFRRFGNNGAARIPIVELLGDAGEFRKLGLLIATIALSGTEGDVTIRLTRKSGANINALLVPKARGRAQLSPGVRIGSVSYSIDPAQSIAVDIPVEYRPWFGFVNFKDGKQARINYELPEWVESAVVLQSSAESNLLLAKLLLDLSAETDANFEGFTLTHQDRSVASGGYEAGFWLTGSEYDKYAYSEY